MRLVTTLVVVAVFAVCAAGAAAKEHCGKLGIDTSVEVGVPEVSGLALVTHGSAAIYAVGDATYRIARISVGADPPRIEEFDAAPSFRGSGIASQWEAVADGGRGLCVLAETTARVWCFDQDLHRVVTSFALDVSAPPDLAAAWAKEPNSRGEGLVLLRRGHVLVLKEKKPPLVVEFGPAGDAPLGFTADAVLAANTPFDAPENGTLAVLAAWRFSDALQAFVTDGSELAVGPDHRLYLLSDESRMLVRLQRELRPGVHEVNADTCWRVPKELAHPEGLVIDAEMRPWIAVDEKKTSRPNVFRMRAIGRQP